MEANNPRPARIFVLYHSRTGHTKLMADLVAEGAGSVPNTEVRMKSVEEATTDDLAWCDGIAVGSPTHMGSISSEMKRWWDDTARPLWPRIEGKIGCGSSSSGGLSSACLSIRIRASPSPARMVSG